MKSVRLYNLKNYSLHRHLKRGLLLVAVLGSCASTAQSLSISDGVFTVQQAAAGQVLYQENCARCHDLQFYHNSLRSWTDMTILDYWYKILGNMPADKPGSLSRTEYLELIAFILADNGFPAGELPLEPNNRLGKIKIVSPAMSNER